MRVRASFQGRVQGVGFRATARDIASRHPVAGWVRNEPDGSVTLEAQGDPAAVDAFLADLSRVMARTIRTSDRAEVPDAVPAPTGFEIRR
jgi:acylphosphatase